LAAEAEAGSALTKALLYKAPAPRPALLLRSIGFCASRSAIGGHGLAGLSGLAEVGLLELPEIVHVEVAVGFEPVFMGLDG